MGFFKKSDYKKNQSITANLYHVDGLPLPERNLCKIELDSTQLSIDGGGTKFSIDVSQIKDAQFKVENVPAPNGGIWMTCYLLISYINKSGQVNSASFKTDNATTKPRDIKYARKIADELTLRTKNSNIVEL
ncbi:hypothetical protein BSK59_08585 [Paenibacillus odorifer]|uniref:hypothetical protein n=1 Tax=Paenibacillus TaxID=44249 RepID=UPI00096F8594|nr:hypothetical protein [Paenibacillus odorifer]OME58229.1 hypothetical protein BSK59_08585 [Paenibacillus odorifer]